MKNALKTLALCSALATSTAALADADQTKLYDPMTAKEKVVINIDLLGNCLLYTSPSPRDTR